MRELKNTYARRVRFNRVVVWAVLAVVLVAAVLWLHRVALLRGAAKTETIYQNIFINNVNVGGLTRAEAESALVAYFQPALDKKIIRLTENGTITAAFSFVDFEARYNFSALVSQAWQYARAGTSAERYKQITGLSRKPVAFNGAPDYAYNAGLVEKRLAEVAKKVYVNPINARLEWNGKTVNLIDGRAGQALDAETIYNEIRKLLDACREGDVDIACKTIPPSFASSDFTYPQSVIGHYETSYNPSGNDARNINLRVAAERINNTMLYPGEIFSASEALGAVTAENGYARATVIVGGKPADDYGGGVCQAVTTLYNAVLRAEVPVVERFNHSLRVSYADYGFDATVAGNYFDLKFKNDTPHPFLIICEMQNGCLSVDLLGYEVHGAGRALTFASELVETIPPAPEALVTDATLPPGSAVVSTVSQNGYRYDVYKYIYENGLVIGKEKVNTSVYKPVRGVINVGG